jgi:hypothetical protein
LFYEFGELILYLGLYIKKELFSSVPQPLGLPVLLNIFGMAFSVPLQIARMVIKPLFDPRVVITATVGIFLSPSRIVFGLAGFFTGRISAGLLPLTHPRVRDKEGSTIRTLLPFHLGFPLRR